MGKGHYADFIASNIGRYETRKVVVATSGGVESVACCALLNDEGYNVYSYFCDYGQPALAAERFVVQQLKEKRIVREVFESKLSILKAMPKDSLDDNDSFVPFRNVHIMLNAATIAEKLDADGIAIGYTSKIDEGVFFDNSFANHQIMQALLSANLGRDMKVLLPVKTKTKFEMLSFLWARKLQSVSCWNAEIRVDTQDPRRDYKITTCHKCAQCQEREEAEKGLL